MTPKYKILIVEDDIPSAELLKAILEQYNYLIYHADDGRKAVDLAKEIYPDLAIIDIMLPTLNGFEVCEHIREIPTLDTLPIIMLTVLNEPQHRIRAIQAGATDFLTKPFERLELLAKIQSLLGLKDEFSHRELFENIKYCLLIALENRCPDIAAHCHRVAKLSEQIGIRLGLTSSTLEELKLGAVLHDIGVLGVKEKDENDSMHTLIGDQMFSRFNRPIIRSIIKSHHEKINGGGFPEGICGNDIEITVKIVALSNRFDELVNSKVPEQGKLNNVLNILWNEVAAGYWDKHVMQELEQYVKLHDN